MRDAGGDVLGILAAWSMAAALAAEPARPDGVWTHRHDNGAIWSVGEYANGRPVGTWRYFYEDGRPESEGAFADGAKHGPWVHWQRSGAKASEGAWDHGLKTGVWTTFDADGAWKTQAIWVAGRLDGIEVRWNRAPDAPPPPDLHLRLAGLDEARGLLLVTLPAVGKASPYQGLDAVFGDIP